MPIAIAGILLDPYGNIARFADIRMVALTGYGEVIETANSTFRTDDLGAYSINVQFGRFAVYMRFNGSNGSYTKIQAITVNSSTIASNLGELLAYTEPLTPEEILIVQALVAEAVAAKNLAEAAALAAALSATNSANSATDSASSANAAANSVALLAPVPLNGGVWASGQIFNFYNQYMIYNGEAYSPIPATTLPYTVGAVPDLGFVYQIQLNSLQLLSGLTEPSNLDSVFYKKFNSVSSMKAANAGLLVGQTVTSPQTKWQISASPTYSMPYANRAKLFNALSLGGGKYAIPYSGSIHASDFLDESVTATNDDAVGEISSIMRDGLKLDFGGKMYRVYANTAGIPSSGATPATSRAQLLTRMLFMNGLRDISFGAGGLYAANQSTAGAKNYFPSTLYLKQCQNVHFDEGSIFESKGESWGDSDSSFTLTKDQRQDFLGQNGGHAIVAVRCKTITGSPTARLCGSVGPFYSSSSEDVRLESPFSNPASLGYAAFAFDAWAGNVTESGRKNFHGNLHNPVAHAETLTRREDGVANGSSLYCGKGGVLTEDANVIITSIGGYIADMYANGSAKTLGYAFGAGVYSKCVSIGAIVRNCQEVAYAGVSAAGTAECIVTDVDAVVGLTGCMFDNQSFGTCRITLKGKVRVNNSRVWVGEVETLANTSLVASMKSNSSAFALINCDAAPDLAPPSGKLGEIFALISNKNSATYGGVIIEGGEYVTTGYLIRSMGWGSSQAGERVGLVIKAGAKIRDDSTAATDACIQYTNKSATNTFTYIHHDLENMDLKTKGFRSLSSGYVIEGTGLVNMLLMPRKLGVTTYSTVAYRPKETLSVQLTSVVGLTGINTRLAFVMSDGRIPSAINCWVTSQGVQHKVINIYTPTVSGPLRCDLMVENDVRSQFLAGQKYTIFGA